MKTVCVSVESEWTPGELDVLEGLGEFIQVKELPKTEEETINILKDADYAIISPLPFGNINEKIINALPNLKGICLTTTRFAWVDLTTAKKKGVVVANLPGYSTTSVAELAVGLMFDVARKITPAVISTRNGNRSFTGYDGFELKGKTLGVIGLGSIGTHLAGLGKGLGMNVVGFNRTKKDSDIIQVSIEELLQISDVISMNLSFNEETRHFLNRENLRLVKPTSILINVSPEDLIDQEVVFDMLINGNLAGYGYELDMNRTYDIQNKLIQLPNVVATPHIGWYTPEAEQRVKDMTIENLRAMISGKPINNLTK